MLKISTFVPMYQPLEYHITKLLYQHDCVVLPNLGALLARRHFAEANPATGMLRPPSRRAHFNASIKENDGILANAVARAERISYKEAAKKIDAQIALWQQQLADGTKLKLKGVGRLYVDDHGNLQFTPSLENNFLTSSYGLPIFRMAPLQREAEIRKTIHRVIEKHAPVVTEKTDEKRRSFSWAAVLLPLAFAGIAGTSYYSYQNSDYENQAGFHWLKWGESRQLPVENKSIDAEEALVIEDKGNKVAEENGIKNNSENVSSNAKTPEVREVENKMEEIPEVSTSASVAAGFHIVVGSFKEKQNAESYILQLQAKGFDAYLANGNANFNRVAIGNFETRDAANSDLNSIRSQVNSGAWVFAN